MGDSRITPELADAIITIRETQEIQDIQGILGNNHSMAAPYISLAGPMHSPLYQQDIKAVRRPVIRSGPLSLLMEIINLNTFTIKAGGSYHMNGITDMKKMTSAASDLGAKLKRVWNPIQRILTFSPADDMIARRKTSPLP